MTVALVIILLIMAFGATPQWDYSRDWGYAPSLSLSFIGVVIVILLLMGVL